MSRIRNTDVVVGVVVFLSLVILVGGVMFLKEVKFTSKTYTLRCYFPAVSNLTTGDPVKVNGVKSGKVTDIKLEKGQVLVTMEVDKSIILTEGSRITIQNVGLMGERMVGIQLKPGTPPLDISQPLTGYFDSGIAEAMGMMGEVFGQIQVIVAQLNEIVQQTVGDPAFLSTFQRIMKRLDNISATAENLVQNNAGNINGMAKDLNSTVGNVKSLVDDNKDKMQGIINNLSAVSGKADNLVDRLQSISGGLDQLMTEINRPTSSVHMLLNDKEFYTELKSTLTSLDSLIKKIEKDKLKVKVNLW
jgi:phospholipid/cholesterol/gamma-HCH transport system substrate-binding protein